jgi:hypothetical protein
VLLRVARRNPIVGDRDREDRPRDLAGAIVTHGLPYVVATNHVPSWKV